MTTTETALATTVAPTTATEVANLQREIEADALPVLATRVASEIDDQFADALLTEVVRRKDTLATMRASATGPLYKAAKVIESSFAPALGTLARMEAHLKSERGAFAVIRAANAAKARAAAIEAARVGDGSAIVEALTAAAESEAPTGARGGAPSLYWAPAGYDVERMDRAFLLPDERKIAALAKAHKGDAPPVLAGVTFERRAAVRGKR